MSTDFTLNLVEVDVARFKVSRSSVVPPTPTPMGETTTVEIAAVTKYGDDGGEHSKTVITTAELTAITWPQTCAPAIAEFVVSWDDADIAQLPTSAVPFPDEDNLTHEVQIRRNGSVIFTGPVVARAGNSKDRVFSYIAKDPLWYLQGKYFGEANRHNYLFNPGFEDDPTDPTSWNLNGDGTASIDTDDYLTGTQSVFLQGTGSNLELDQSRSITTGNLGLAMIFTVWIKRVYANLSFSNSAAVLVSQLNPVTAVIEQQALVTIGTQIPMRQWVRLSVALLLPPNATKVWQVGIRAAGDQMKVDSATLTTEESLSFVPDDHGGLPWDQIDMAKYITRYAAGSFPIGSPYTKSDLNLHTSGELSGVFKSKTYQFFDHQQIYQGGIGAGALDEFRQASDGFDFRFEPGPTGRVVAFYYPSAGRTWTPTFRFVRKFDSVDNRVPTSPDDKPAGDSTVVDGDNTYLGGIVYFDWNESIEDSASNVTILGGWGSGAGREEGGANLDVFGDLQLEHIEAAPTGATIDQLDKLAAVRADQLGQVQTTPVLTMVEPVDPTTGEVAFPLIGVLLPGDLMPIRLYNGFAIDVDQTIRVASVKYTHATETLQVGILMNTPEHAVPTLPPKQSSNFLRLGQRLYELERRILPPSGSVGEGD